MDQKFYLFIKKLNVPCVARLRRTSLASIAIPSGCDGGEFDEKMSIK